MYTRQIAGAIRRSLGSHLSCSGCPLRAVSLLSSQDSFEVTAVVRGGVFASSSFRCKIVLSTVSKALRTSTSVRRVGVPFSSFWRINYLFIYLFIGASSLPAQLHQAASWPSPLTTCSDGDPLAADDALPLPLPLPAASLLQCAPACTSAGPPKLPRAGGSPRRPSSSAPLPCCASCA